MSNVRTSQQTHRLGTPSSTSRSEPKPRTPFPAEAAQLESDVLTVLSAKPGHLAVGMREFDVAVALADEYEYPLRPEWNHPWTYHRVTAALTRLEARGLAMVRVDTFEKGVALPDGRVVLQAWWHPTPDGLAHALPLPTRNRPEPVDSSAAPHDRGQTVRRIEVFLAKQADGRWGGQQLTKPAQTLVEAMKKSPNDAGITGDASGVRRLRQQLDKAIPGAGNWFIVSGRNVAFVPGRDKPGRE